MFDIFKHRGARGTGLRFITCLALGVSGLALPLRTARADDPAPLFPDKGPLPWVLSGHATTPSGKPVAGASLFLVGSQSASSLGEGGKLLTDDQGRFAYDVLNADERAVRSNLGLYALPAGKGWQVRVILSPRRTASGTTSETAVESNRRDLLYDAAQSNPTTWRPENGNFWSVVMPEVGTVSLVVRGPDGKPLIAQKVQLVLPNAFHHYFGAVVYEGRTDATGLLTLQAYTGPRRMLVLAPGLGFGSTGTFLVQPNRTVTAHMPPLAPFAHGRGTVAPELRKAGATVQLDDDGDFYYNWCAPQSTIGENGQFTLDEMLPGKHRIVLSDSEGEAYSPEVTLVPGEQRNGVAIESYPPAVKASIAAANTSLKALRTSAKPWVSGRVTDADGKPVIDANVYAICSYYGGIREYQQVLTTKSGADGIYTIADLPNGIGMRSSPRVLIVAVRAGFPPASTSAQIVDQAETEAETPATLPHEFHTDVVMPVQHTSLSVRVLQNGKPVPGAAVRLTPQGGTGLYDRHYVGSSREPASATLANLLIPTAVTDADGKVSFSDLSPGLWDVTVINGKPEDLERIDFRIFADSLPLAFNVSRGIPISEGAPHQFTLNLSQQWETVAFRPLTSQGTVPQDAAIDFMSQGSSPGGGRPMLSLSETGEIKYNFTTPGLWRVTTRFLDLKGNTRASEQEPFFEGNTLVAIAPTLKHPAPLEIRATQRTLGSIRVRLLNENGHPTQGAVVIGAAQYATTLDAKGEAVFLDMPSGQYALTANIAGQAPLPSLGRGDAPFPKDAQLTGVMFLPPQSVVVSAGQETVIELRSQAQSYIRGTLKAADAPGNYSLWGFSDLVQSEVTRYNRQTGEFVAGPFAPGTVTLSVQRIASARKNKRPPTESFRIATVGGQVTHRDLEPALQAATATPTGKAEAMLTMGGVIESTQLSSLQGTVVLADGHTPAWGARVTVFTPDAWQPHQMARTDADGHIHNEEYWYRADEPHNSPPGSPTVPVLVAWLPGATGATVLPYSPNRQERIVLPRPVTAKGIVTMGGQPVGGLNAAFRVVAAYQGQGKLNSLLSLATTVQEDGSFELAGLTPGTYQIQVARDDIWLSQTQTVVVGAADPAPLKFDIGVPGAPITLHITDNHGQARGNATIKIMRPPGPLSGILWPQTLTTDSAGNLHLDGLEAGKHQLRIEDGSLPRPSTTTLTVEPLRADAAVQTTTLIVPAAK